MQSYRSSLAPVLAITPATPDQLQAMASAAWRSRGVVVIQVDQLTDEWERQMVMNLANRLFGPRLPPRPAPRPEQLAPAPGARRRPGRRP